MKLKFLIILFSIPLVAFTQKQWSLSECVNYALEHNISAKQQQLAITYAENTLFQSQLGLLPNVNAGAAHTYNWGQRIDPFTNQFATERVRSNDFNISGNVLLFNNFQKHKQIKQNQLELRKNQYDLESLLDNISLQIAMVYLQTLFYNEAIETNLNQIEVTKQQVERTQKLVDVGTIAKGDLLLLESQLLTEEKYLVDSQNNYDISLLTLSQLMEMNSQEKFAIEKPLIEFTDTEFISMSAEEIYSIALSKRPEIISAEYGVESAKKGLSIAKTSYYPYLSLTGSWGTGYSGARQFADIETYQTVPIGQTESGEQVFTEVKSILSYKTVAFSNQLKDNKNIYLGLKLNIPVFNAWQSRTNVNNARINIENKQYGLIQKKNELRKAIQQAYLDAKATIKAYHASQKKMEAIKESYKYSKLKFEVGKINPLELNETKKELSNAESELLQNKYDYIFKTKVLDFYMGKPIVL